jgi:hypothetical protein
MNREMLKLKIRGLCPWVVVSRGVTSDGAGKILLEQSVTEGENPVYFLQTFMYGTLSKSRALWNWSVKWEVHIF